MMTEKAIGGAKGSPLRQRMIDQMRIANLAASTRAVWRDNLGEERRANWRRGVGASPTGRKG